MYMRRQRRRQLRLATILLIGLVVLAPRFDLPSTPQLWAFWVSVAQGQPQIG